MLSSNIIAWMIPERYRRSCGTSGYDAAFAFDVVVALGFDNAFIDSHPRHPGTVVRVPGIATIGVSMDGGQHLYAKGYDVGPLRRRMTWKEIVRTDDGWIAANKRAAPQTSSLQPGSTTVYDSGRATNVPPEISSCTLTPSPYHELRNRDQQLMSWREDPWVEEWASDDECENVIDLDKPVSVASLDAPAVVETRLLIRSPTDSDNPRDISLFGDVYCCPCGRHHRGSRGGHSLNGPNGFSSRTFNLTVQERPLPMTRQDRHDADREQTNFMFRQSVRRYWEGGIRTRLERVWNDERSEINRGVILLPRIQLLPAVRFMRRAAKPVITEALHGARQQARQAHLMPIGDRRPIHRGRRELEGAASGYEAMKGMRTEVELRTAAEVAREEREHARGTRGGKKRRPRGEIDRPHPKRHRT